ncbi:MAG: 3,4-dehydroadipyl-CoA semialdehyde dehydrogenase [Kofleriaceae bacterium]
MQLLASFLAGGWSNGSPGSGAQQVLVNPATEAAIAEVPSGGHDLAGAFSYARMTGAAELGALTFAQRGDLVAALAKAIHGAREELIALAIANGGNTRGDAKFDIDGAAATLSYYAELGAKLGGAKLLGDGEPIQVGRTARMGGQHVWASRRGVAVQINAFNFPAWGTCEKLACSLLAGVPAISKPATATALVAHRLAQLFEPLLPAGALQMLIGPAGALLDHVEHGDVVAFTGGSATARLLRAKLPGTRLNIEADSLNAAVLAPDVELTSEVGNLFVADVVRDMTQKAGQKCTAIRRVLVPIAKIADVCEAIKDRLATLKIGNPELEEVRMGPVATAQQLADVRAGIARLAEATTSVHGGTGEVTPLGVPEGKGYFVGPVVRLAKDPMNCPPLHEHEVFGPVTTLGGYPGDAAFAAAFIAKGEGCLVSSAYSDDREWMQGFVAAAAPWAGRLYLGSSKMAAQSPGPGTVLPSLVHGGPGRAGGGEELGGTRGLQFYMQRCALEGDASVLKALLA